MYAPVIVFTYKRLDKTIECLKALSENRGSKNTDLIIFSDGPKTDADYGYVSEVRSYLKKFSSDNKNFNSIFINISEKNKGLATSIIEGVTKVINKYGTAIVVEDDLITSKDFLEYMNGALDFYKDDDRIGSVSAYTTPMKCLNKYKKDIYITRKGECWGWATWKKYWNAVDWTVSSFQEYVSNQSMRKEFDSIGAGLDNMLCLYMKGELDIWAVRWCYYLYRNHLLTVYPRVSRAKNIGFDGSGEHCSELERLQSGIDTDHNKCKFEKLCLDLYLEKKSVQCELGCETIRERMVNKILKMMHELRLKLKGKVDEND